MTGLQWKAVRHEFAFDGSWRDIYVLGTDMAAWQRMLDGLRSVGYDLTYLRDSKPTELPATAVDAFPPLNGDYSCLLSVRFSGVLANCHFFTPKEIEFDIDPREVTGQGHLDALLDFMQCLAASVGQDAILCPENSSQMVIFRVRSNGVVEYSAPDQQCGIAPSMTFNRIASVLVAAAYVAAGLASGRDNSVVAFSVIGALFPLPFIWFPGAFGRYIGLANMGYVNRPTPAVFVAFAGWLLLMIVPAVILTAR
jgi:hypothetical protein